MVMLFVKFMCVEKGKNIGRSCFTKLSGLIQAGWTKQHVNHFRALSVGKLNKQCPEGGGHEVNEMKDLSS